MFLLTLLVLEKKCWERKSALQRRKEHYSFKENFWNKYRYGQPSCLGGVSVSENLNPHNVLWNLWPLECPYCRIPCFEVELSEQAAMRGDEVFTFIRTGSSQSFP